MARRSRRGGSSRELHTVAADVAHSSGELPLRRSCELRLPVLLGEFCDWYVELVKLRLDFTAPKNETAQLTLNALVSVFETALRLLSPFMPFLTEELWHALYAAIDTICSRKVHRAHAVPARRWVCPR